MREIRFFLTIISLTILIIETSIRSGLEINSSFLCCEQVKNRKSSFLIHSLSFLLL